MPMSECSSGEMQDLLPVLATGRLAPARRVEVEAHVAGCASCRAELALVQAARHVLSRAPAVDVGRIAAAVPAYRAAAPASDPSVIPIASRRRVAPAAWRIAAAALLVVGGGTAIAVQQSRDDAPGNAPMASAPPAAVTSGGAPAALAAADSPIAGAVTPVATGTDAGRAPGAGTPQLSFGGGLEGLTDADLVALLAAIDETDAVPGVEPDAAFPGLSLDGEEES